MAILYLNLVHATRQIEIYPSINSRVSDSLPHKALNKVVFPDPEGPRILKNYPNYKSPLTLLIIFFG